MSWREITENDLASTLSQGEIEAFRQDGAQDGADAVSRTIALATAKARIYISSNSFIRIGPLGTLPEGVIPAVCDIVAYRLLRRLPVAVGEDRRLAAQKAEEMLEKIANGLLKVESDDEEDELAARVATTPAHAEARPARLLDSILAALAIFAGVFSAQARDFEIDLASAKSPSAAFYHGETIVFKPLLNGSIPTNITFSTVYYQTNGMNQAWWNTDGLVFHPTNDVGAASYRFFLSGIDSSGRDWRYNGLLRFMASPGFTPNTLTPPIETLNFDSLEIQNPPWPAEIAAATNAVLESARAADTSLSNNLARAIADATPADYSEVSSLARTSLQEETDPTISAWAKASTKPTYTLNEIAPDSENWLGVQGNAGRHIKILTGISDGNIVGGLRVTASTQNDNNMTTYTYNGVAVKRMGSNTDYLWDTSAQNGIVRRSELASKADSAALDTATNRINVISTYLEGDDARIVISNLNSQASLPTASLEYKTNENWVSAWNDLDRHNWLISDYLPTNYYSKSQTDSLLDEKADRAWGFYDSHSGLYAPDNYTWISSASIAVSGGMSYQRTLTSEGAIWVLTSSGIVEDFSGTVSNGFFRVCDDEGNVHFEIVKGNKRTVGASPSSLQIVQGYSPTRLQIGYDVISQSHPTCYVTANLSSPNWKSEDDANCIANVSWSGSSGAWVATVYGKSAQPTMFVKAEYETGGDTYINNVAPVAFTNLIIDGTNYALHVETVNNKKYLILSE